MEKLSQKELAKMSVDIFANNPEDKFYATEDGNFFPREVDAKKHAKITGSPIYPFERKSGSIVKQDIVTQEELIAFVEDILDKISANTGFSRDDLGAMVRGEYVKPEIKAEETKEVSENTVEEVKTPETKTEADTQEKKAEAVEKKTEEKPNATPTTTTKTAKK